MTVEIERQWAEGLSQEEFERGFMQRNPFSDVMPRVEDWIKKSPPKYKGINAIQGEDYEWSDNPKAIEQQEILDREIAREEVQGITRTEDGKRYTCRGCGKEMTVKAGWMRHETFCKATQNLKLIYEKLK